MCGHKIIELLSTRDGRMAIQQQGRRLRKPDAQHLDSVFKNRQQCIETGAHPGERDVKHVNSDCEKHQRHETSASAAPVFDRTAIALHNYIGQDIPPPRTFIN